ncbi:MAG: hypothetical protein ACLR4X_05210 [Clostridia bacterium]
MYTLGYCFFIISMMLIPMSCYILIQEITKEHSLNLIMIILGLIELLFGIISLSSGVYIMIYIL